MKRAAESADGAGIQQPRVDRALAKLWGEVERLPESARCAVVQSLGKGEALLVAHAGVVITREPTAFGARFGIGSLGDAPELPLEAGAVRYLYDSRCRNQVIGTEGAAIFRQLLGEAWRLLQGFGA